MFGLGFLELAVVTYPAVAVGGATAVAAWFTAKAVR